MTALRMLGLGAALAVATLLAGCGDKQLVNTDGPIKSIDKSGHAIVVEDTGRSAKIVLPVGTDMAQFTVGQRARLQVPTNGTDVTLLLFQPSRKDTATVVEIRPADKTVLLSNGIVMPVPKPSDFAFMKIGLPITVDNTPKPITFVVKKGTGKPAAGGGAKGGSDD